MNRPLSLRALTSHEIYDLIRAGVLLVLTVGLAVIIPPRVWDAGGPAQPPLQIELTK